MTKSSKYGKSTKNVKTIAMATVAAALAGALSMGTALPALAEEAAADQSQPAIVAQDDATADENSWDATADEGGFSADATTTYATDLGATQSDVAGADGNGWWWRRVSPADALNISENYFGIGSCDDWDYQVGRFRGTPAYRVEIDVDDDWHGPQPHPYVWGQGNDADADANGITYYGGRGGWQPWGGTTRYVAFVNYFTGQVMGAYVDYE